MKYTVHTIETAPEEAKETLRGVEKKFGFLPNILGVMAEAPALAEGYGQLSRLFAQTSLTTTEQQVILLTVSHDNGCEYCVAAHSVGAAMNKVAPEVIDAIRDGRPIDDERLEALRRFTASMVNSLGWPSEADIRAFTDAGYTKTQILEVILGIGLKTLSNYTNHIAETPLDNQFASAEWSKVA